MAIVTWAVFAVMVAVMFALAYHDTPVMSTRIRPNVGAFDSPKEMR